VNFYVFKISMLLSFTVSLLPRAAQKKKESNVQPHEAVRTFHKRDTRLKEEDNWEKKVVKKNSWQLDACR